MCVSLDGYVTTPDGWPVQLADPNWTPHGHGFREFQAACDAVLMGRTTFEPALGAGEWPWGDLHVFVLGSQRPAGTPEHVVVDSDPERLLQTIRSTLDGDVHLVGGPRTIETFRRLGALDRLGLIVVPVIVGGGMQLTPALDLDTRLTLESERRLETGAVELVYTPA
jgi:dihydrofolate reductase